MHPGSDQNNSLDLYLDNLLSSEERDRFEADLRASAHAEAEVRCQHTIDAALRRHFVVTPIPQAVESVLVEAQRGVGVRRRFLRRSVGRSLAIAAILALGVFGGWRTWRFLSPSPVVDPYAPMEWRPMDEVYRSIVADGFHPDWACKDDEEFARVTRRQLREPLLLAQNDTARAVGWRYANTLGPNTMCLLATASHQASSLPEKIIVFVDRMRNDRPPDPRPDSSLKVHRREIGSVVLYEVSPLDHPRILDRFYQPGDGPPPTRDP